METQQFFQLFTGSAEIIVLIVFALWVILSLFWPPRIHRAAILKTW